MFTTVKQVKALEGITLKRKGGRAFGLMYALTLDGHTYYFNGENPKEELLEFANKRLTRLPLY